MQPLSNHLPQHTHKSKAREGTQALCKQGPGDREQVWGGKVLEEGEQAYMLVCEPPLGQVCRLGEVQVYGKLVRVCDRLGQVYGRLAQEHGKGLGQEHGKELVQERGKEQGQGDDKVLGLDGRGMVKGGRVLVHRECG
jgi:hypothetical protein